MPVPAYLKKLAYEASSKGCFSRFRLMCECGSNSFYLFKSYLDKEEIKLCKPYDDACREMLFSGRPSTYTIDENGIGHHWLFLSDDITGPKEEFFLPEKPAFASISAVMIRCAECGREHLIFDSRLHGYCGKYGEHSSEEMAYEPHFKPAGRKNGAPCGVFVKIEHDESPENFKAAAGIDCSLEEYANLFTWISIYSIDANGLSLRYSPPIAPRRARRPQRLSRAG